MGSVDQGPIKPARSHCPMARRRSVSIRRLTDDAITRLHPRKSCCSKSSFFVRSASRFSIPTWVPGWRRAQPQSRLAEGHRRRRARSGLDGGEHGAKLRPVGARLILRSAAVVCLTHHHRPADTRHPRPAPGQALLASAQAATLRCLLASNLTNQGSSLARLLHSTDIAPHRVKPEGRLLTSSRRR